MGISVISLDFCKQLTVEFQVLSAGAILSVSSTVVEVFLFGYFHQFCQTDCVV